MMNPKDLEIGYFLNLVNIFQLNVSFIKMQNMFVKKTSFSTQYDDFVYSNAQQMQKI